MIISRAAVLPWAALALVAVVPACTDNTSDEDATTIAVVGTDDTCDLDVTTAPAGDLVFEVTNDGSITTELYFLSADGEQVLAEVEDVGPGLTRTLSVDADPGDYVVACKPGEVDPGIRVPFTVTDAAS